MRRSLRLATLLSGAFAPLLASGSPASRPVVMTAEGPVRGIERGHGIEYRGIPFAAPPLGKLRWQPPAPVKRWKRPLDASRFPADCAQVTTLGAFAGPATDEEDCLYLNIFKPGPKAGSQASPSAGRRLPVIVFIHGGGNVAGGSRGYDGSQLSSGGAAGKPVVVVTINYRLGLFGFLAHPALAIEHGAAGNYGLMDQQAALRWVKRNIAAFGGDPDRVTLAGQSAGATDLAGHQISPMSAGLFHRAIYQSSPWSEFAPLPTALAAGEAFARAAGCSADASAAASACLRALPASKILALQGGTSANGPFVVGPMVDGVVVPMTPLAAWRTGRFHRMPIMGGATRDEASFGVGITQYFAPGRAAMPLQDYVDAVRRLVGGAAFPGGSVYPAGTAERALAHYDAVHGGAAPQEKFNFVRSDTIACRNSLIMGLWAKSVPVYAYEFSDRSAPYYFPEMPGFTPLAAHTSDLQFLFPGWQGGPTGANRPPILSPDQKRLSEEMVAAWTRFADSGNPNIEGETAWPKFGGSEGAPAILSQDVPESTHLTMEDWSSRHQCDFWTGGTLDPASGLTGGLLRLQP